jgi:hypothetical protein
VLAATTMDHKEGSPATTTMSTWSVSTGATVQTTRMHGGFSGMHNSSQLHRQWRSLLGGTTTTTNARRSLRHRLCEQRSQLNGGLSGTQQASNQTLGGVSGGTKTTKVHGGVSGTYTTIQAPGRYPPVHITTNERRSLRNKSGVASHR